MSSQEFAGFSIVRRLTSGGMTNLYLAVDPVQQHRVVIRRMKLEFLKDRRLRTSFLHGAEILAKLRHPNIVRMLKSGMVVDEPYMVLDYVESKSLREMILHRDQLLSDNLLSILRQMAQALGFVHASGFLHLDFKPENLLVRYDGLVVLVDFDLSLDRKPKPIKLSPLPGTSSYLPPESLIHSTVDEQTDIYAFGVTAFEMLTGHKPFEGITPEDSRKMQIDPNQLPRRLKHFQVHTSPAMETLIFKCLAYLPEARYPSMSLVARDLETMV